MKDARRYSFQPPESDDRAAHVVHFLSALYTLRRVRNDEPVQAALLHQSAFLLPRRNDLSHPQRSQNGVIDAVLRDRVIRYVA